jgi:threonine aldolase
MIDLRSDTVSAPTTGMRRAIMLAQVGDDVYGEDPTVRALEEKCAALFGYPAAVFTPTVTMANLVGLSLVAAPGDEVICDVNAHIVRYEGGAAAVSGGIQTRTTSGTAGIVPVSVLETLVRSGAARSSSSGVRTAAVAIEQTHNQYGGRVYPLERMRELREFTRQRGIAIHCDGARIWNAQVASGVKLSDYGGACDSVAVCLSKGLGCPAGALLAVADEEQAGAARRLRRRQGGTMRQAGILAAAGLFALENNLERLADDHDRAAMIARAAEDARPGTVQWPVDTNMVYLNVPADRLPGFLQDCREAGVLITAVHGKRARVVTHLGVSGQDARRAADVLAGRLRRLPPQPAPPLTESEI